MLLALLLGFAPLGTPSGPPAVHLARTPATQWALASSPTWLAFQAVWGQSYVRWDERNATPRFLGLAAVPEGDAELLVADIAALAGVPAAELDLAESQERPHGNGTRSYLRYTRHWQGVPVEGDEIVLVSTNGVVGGAWVRLTRIGALPTPAAGERVVADPERGFGVLVRKESRPQQVLYRERSGRVLYAYDPRRFDSVSIEHEELTVDDPRVVSPAAGLTVTDASSASATTAVDGSHGLSGPVSVLFSGPYLGLYESSALVSATGEGDSVLVGGTDVSDSAAATWIHTLTVRSWLEALWPTHAWLDDVVLAQVNLNYGTCNAYYTGGTINFYAADSVCNATGRMASVVYHEYGHGIHDYIRASGTFAGDVSEGSADYVSATLLEDATIGENFFVGGGNIREIDTDKRYPDDVSGEVHNDGLIWASFLWNLRAQWQASMGESAGVEATDLLFLGALEQGPELTDLMEAVLLADDDDGDWSNGTPHDCELITLLDQHGLGAGSMGVVTLSHVPLEPQASDTEGYPVSADLDLYFGTCTGLAAPTLTVWATSDDSARLPSSDGTGWEGWFAYPTATTDDRTYTTVLPRVPAARRVRYFTQLTSADGTESAVSHRDIEDDLYTFWVGDRRELSCVDFESGATGFVHGTGIPWTGATGTTDEWDVGPTTGIEPYDPDSAYSGTELLGTALDATYSASNAQYLLTPSTALDTPGRMRLLTYRRWLTVEDGVYDRALIAVSDGTTTTSYWGNPGTPSADTHILDTDWIVRDHDLRPFLDDLGMSASPLSFAFALSSDGGLEFGGWALDDLCVVELNDEAEHYRRAGLVATWTDPGTPEVGEVELNWHTPWIEPVTTVVLVRKAGAWPTDLTDGVVVDLDLSPVVGEERSAVDTLPGLERGTTWYYALFVAAADRDAPYLVAEEGKNGAVVDFPVLDTGEPTDTAVDDTAGDTADTAVADDSAGDTNEEPKPEPEPEGCGCNGAPSAGAVAGLFGLALIARRRR